MNPNIMPPPVPAGEICLIPPEEWGAWWKNYPYNCYACYDFPEWKTATNYRRLHWYKPKAKFDFSPPSRRGDEDLLR